ncbi:MFS transporter [Amycolatopsis thermoflava]|uniref:MFS transporter n=1 Tax=Amycolatopsis thermoflava TaxID=84480 RepID=UPI00381AE926
MTTVPARRRAALVVLCLVQFMLVLDDNVVSVALPSIRHDLGFSGPGLAWVVNAYFLAFGGLLLLAGRVADLFGRRRVFLIGVALFGLASLACGLARQPWQLVAGRFVQGAGAAMAGPAALSLIALSFPGTAERARALAIWGAVAALGGTAGLVISSVLTGLTSWRWIFLINLPVTATGILLLPRLTPESRAGRRSRLDIPGTLLGTAAVVSLVYGLLQAGGSGWADRAVLGPLLVAAVLAAGFVMAEARIAEPLVPLSLLSDRTRAVANGATLLFSAAFYAMAFLLMIHLQTVLGYGPRQAGLAYLPYGAEILAGMRVSTRVMTRMGLRWGPGLLVPDQCSRAAAPLRCGGGRPVRHGCPARDAGDERGMRAQPADLDRRRGRRHHWGERPRRLGVVQLGAANRRRRRGGGTGHGG